MSSHASALPPCLLMSLHVSTKGFCSFSQLNNFLLCTFTHLFYPLDFWWILRLLPSLDYCCALTFENVLTINVLHFPSPTHPPSEGQISCFSKPGPEGQICLYWSMWFILFLKIWLHCTACRIWCWAVNTQIPICWPTREFPVIYFLKFTNHHVSPKKDVGMRKIMKRRLKWREGRNNTKNTDFLNLCVDSLPMPGHVFCVDSFLPQNEIFV